MICSVDVGAGLAARRVAGEHDEATSSDSEERVSSDHDGTTRNDPPNAHSNVPPTSPEETDPPLLHSALERVPETQQPSPQPRPIARESTLQDRHRYAASARRKQQRSACPRRAPFRVVAPAE